MKLKECTEIINEIQQTSSPLEHQRIISTIIEDHKDEIIDEFITDLKLGVADETDEIKDALLEEEREEIEKEIKAKYDEGNIAWVYVKGKLLDKTMQDAISALTSLSEILRLSNSIAADDELLTPIQKDQLVAVLKSMIAELEAPYVDRGRIKSVMGWVSNIGKKAAENKVRTEVNNGFEYATQTLSKVLKEINGSETSGIF